MNVFLLELRNIRKSAAVSSLAVSLIFIFMLAFYPSMKTESMQALTGAKLEGMDPALLAALGLSEMVDFTVISNYFGYILQFAALAVMVIATHQAVSLLIKEESDGTIEYLCAKPVSRTEIFTQKLLAHVTVLALTMLLYIAVTAGGYMIFGGYDLGAALKETAILFSGILFAALIFSSIGILFSAVVKSSSRAVGVAMALVFGSFILGILSTLVKELGFLVWFSPLDWVKAAKLLKEGLRVWEWVPGCAIIVMCTASALVIYKKKDLLI